MILLLLACTDPDTGVASPTAGTSEPPTGSTGTGTTGTGATSTTATTTLPPPTLPEVFETYAFHFGELHVHTSASGDGCSEEDEASGHCAPRDQAIDLAREQGLSFVALSDHVNGSPAESAEDFANLLTAVIARNDPEGGLVTIPAGEAWFTLDGEPLGHRNIYFFGDDATLAALTLDDIEPTLKTTTDVASCDAIWDWMAETVGRWGDVLLIPHHPATSNPMPVDWGCHDPAWEPAVEVYSAHGNSLEVAPTYDPLWSEAVPESTVHAALDPEGYALELGFLGGTDAHDGRPGETCDRRGPSFGGGWQVYGGGLAAVVLPPGEALSRAAIHDALVERRTYATTGPKLPAWVDYSQGDRLVATMGQRVEVAGDTPLQAWVRVPPEDAGLVPAVRLRVGLETTLEAIETEPGTWWAELPADALPGWVYPEIEVDGPSWWGALPCDDGGDTDDDRIWLSPTWFDAAG